MTEVLSNHLPGNLRRFLTVPLAASLLTVSLSFSPFLSSNASATPKSKVNKAVPKKTANLKRSTTSKASLSHGTINTPPILEKVTLMMEGQSKPELLTTPSFKSTFLGRYASLDQRGNYVFYSLSTELQQKALELVKKAPVPHVAVVALDPKSGEILALAEKSNTLKNAAMHNGYPAASLFKIVSAAAALEKSSVKPNSVIPFRGGIYTLAKWNYLPNSKTDKNKMDLTLALGKSVNPVFGRLAVNYLSTNILKEYTRQFGFNASLPSDLPLAKSLSTIPSDKFELARTSAGFGEVYTSPVHAAAFMGGIANKGFMLTPTVIEKVITPAGAVLYTGKKIPFGPVVKESTARTLMDMLESTTTNGTSKKYFIHGGKKVLNNIRVAGKTGTLTGSNPQGLTRWFIGAAPIDDPKIAVAVVSINSGDSQSRPSYIAREIFKKHLLK